MAQGFSCTEEKGERDIRGSVDSYRGRERTSCLATDVAMFKKLFAAYTLFVAIGVHAAAIGMFSPLLSSPITPADPRPRQACSTTL